MLAARDLHAPPMATVLWNFIGQLIDRDMGFPLVGITRHLREVMVAHPLHAPLTLAFLMEVKVNGYACKNSADISANDFSFAGLGKPGSTDNTMGSVVTTANVLKIPGLNTLGVSMSRIDYAPGGQNPPHTHPRASEVIFVLYGELDVGFITSNKLVSKHITAGDIHVFPKALVHFEKNNGGLNASVISAFNSHFPGTQLLADMFHSAPKDVLTKALQVGTKEINKIKSRLFPKK